MVITSKEYKLGLWVSNDQSCAVFIQSTPRYLFTNVSIQVMISILPPCLPPLPPQMYTESQRTQKANGEYGGVNTYRLVVVSIGSLAQDRVSIMPAQEYLLCA